MQSVGTHDSYLLWECLQFPFRYARNMQESNNQWDALTGHNKTSDVVKLQSCLFQGPYLMRNHAADLGQEVLTDDTVEVAVLLGGFVLDAVR